MGRDENGEPHAEKKDRIGEGRLEHIGFSTVSATVGSGGGRWLFLLGCDPRRRCPHTMMGFSATPRAVALWGALVAPPSVIIHDDEPGATRYDATMR